MTTLNADLSFLRREAQSPFAGLDPDDAALLELDLKNNGLVAFVDAFNYDGVDPMWMQDKAYGRPIVATEGRSPALILSDPAFNGRPSFNFGAILHSLRSNMRLRQLYTMQDFTFVAVATRPALPQATSQVLLSGNQYFDGSVLRASRMIGTTTDGRLFFSNTGRGGTNFNNVALASLPAGNTAAIYALTYREAIKASQWRINSDSIVNAVVHADPVPVLTKDEHWLGHYSGAGYEGWTARASQILIFDRALNFTALQLLSDLMAAMRATYEIA